jgi:hypothetical protein
MANYGSTDRCTGGTASASSSNGYYPAANAFDNNDATFWLANGFVTQWLKYDFGAGTTWRIAKAVIKHGDAPNAFTLDGSPNNSDWTTILSDNMNGVDGGSETFEGTNTTAYRYVRINMTSEHIHGYPHIFEVQMYEQLPSGNAFFIFLSEAYKRHKKLWTPKLALPEDLGFSY